MSVFKTEQKPEAIKKRIEELTAEEIQLVQEAEALQSTYAESMIEGGAGEQEAYRKLIATRTRLGAIPQTLDILRSELSKAIERDRKAGIKSFIGTIGSKKAKLQKAHEDMAKATRVLIASVDTILGETRAIADEFKTYKPENCPPPVFIQPNLQAIRSGSTTLDHEESNQKIDLESFFKSIERLANHEISK